MEVTGLETALATEKELLGMLQKALGGSEFVALKVALQVRDRTLLMISASLTHDSGHSSAADYFPEPSLNLP
jgi:hypothetical protein